MLKPNGFTFVTDLDGKVHEGETYQCAHCGGHTHVKPFQQASDIGGLCKQCMGLTCPRCTASGLCDPLERKLIRMELNR